MIKISVYYEDRLVTEFEQADTKDVSIGRAAGCSIPLDEASISRLHAVIRYQDGGWLLERKANFGAVLMNGQEVENAPLEGGEEITIGKFSLRVNLEGMGQALAQSPTADVYREDGDGRTQFVSTGVKALFRFEPGSANVAEFLMEKDLAIFGRGSNCDVVLTEKKASRKHFEVRKQGLSFFLKDLNSVNGLTVNGSKVTEAELVPGDVIEVGESKIQFVVENQDYFSRQDQFMPVPAHLQQQPAVENHFPMAAQEPGALGQYEFDPNAGMGGGMPGMAPAHAPEPQISSTDLIGRFKATWSKIPKAQRMRYLTILVVFALITAVLGGPDQEPAKRPPRSHSGSTARTFDQLNQARKKFVVENYHQLLSAQEKKDYNKMLDVAGKILTYVDNYKDTKQYETIAKKQLEEIEERKQREETERQIEARRKEVQALEEKGKPVYEKALNDPKFRTELDSIIQQIYEKAPSNQLAGEWKEGIKRKDEQDKADAEAARVKEERRQKAEDELAAVEAIFKEDQYVKALAEAEKLKDNGWTEKDYLDRVEALKNQVRSKLSSVIDPLLREAANQRQEGGDLVKANDRYSDVLKVDPSNKEALQGKAAIKEILHTRAKRFYAEAILADSVSDLAEAKDKFEKCLRTAPEDDIYKKRCRSKLARFDYFGTSDSGGY
jgi:pSer/pThr/pTyr-binding forkhead associated (FHA) protein